MKKHFAKLFSLLLSVAMIFTVIVYAGAENGTSQNETQSITMTEYDPATGEEVEKVYEVDTSILNAISSKHVSEPSLVSEPAAALLSIDSELADNGFVKVSNTTRRPYSAVGLYKVYSSPGIIHGYGTAFMVSDNVAITCAHNLYNKKNNKWFSSGTFYPGKHGFGVTNDPFDYSHSVKWAVCSQYIENTNENINYYYDWGAIVLNDDIGKKCGKINFAPLSDNEIQNSTHVTIGYPQPDIALGFNYSQYQQQGNPELIMQFYFTSSMACKTGQSGSPVFANNTVCGIVSGRPKDTSINRTYCTRINESVYSYLTQYISENS